MKLYLASYFQSNNWGPGRKISIAPDKPDDIYVDFKFEPFIPAGLFKYRKERYNDPKKAGDEFVTSFNEQLVEFLREVLNDCSLESKTPQQLLPFQEGDTLLSWEHAGNISYRPMVNDILIKLGYETELQ